jgi:hypothetical protein
LIVGYLFNLLIVAGIILTFVVIWIKYFFLIKWNILHKSHWYQRKNLEWKVCKRVG